MESATDKKLLSNLMLLAMNVKLFFVLPSKL